MAGSSKFCHRSQQVGRESLVLKFSYSGNPTGGQFPWPSALKEVPVMVNSTMTAVPKSFDIIDI